MKKFSKFCIFIFTSIFCYSCSIVDKVLSEINNILSTPLDSETKESIFNISIDYSDPKYPNSIKLLDKAFNRNKDEVKTFDFDKTNLENKDNSYLYQVDTNVKSLEYNKYTTPSVGNIRALVIPVEFEDAPAPIIDEKDVLLDDNYLSVSDYYYNSSYGKLNMKFDIVDWFKCSKTSSYYKHFKKSNSSSDTDGVDLIIKEALSYLSKNMDLSIYDSNEDGVIDALYVLYSKNYDSHDNFWWAYQYYDYDNTVYDHKIPYSYIFASYSFLFEDNSKCNPTTFIHESGHLFGLEDYYDYDTSFSGGCNVGGTGGADMMDSNVGDHNTFSKLLTGWIDNPLIVDTTSSITINLKPSSLYDQCIILSNSFDKEKGIFQEYFVIEYYANVANNSKMKIYNQNGIKILHVNATLETKTSDGYTYQYLAYDNSYTNYNLLNIIIDKNGNTYPSTSSSIIYNDEDLFYENESLSRVFYDGYKKNIFGMISGTALNYKIHVDSINDEYATITITRK